MVFTFKELLPVFNVTGTFTSVATEVVSDVNFKAPVPEIVSFELPVMVIAAHSRSVAPRLIVSADAPVAMLTASEAPGIAPPQLAGSPQLVPSPAPDHVAARKAAHAHTHAANSAALTSKSFSIGLVFVILHLA